MVMILMTCVWPGCPAVLRGELRGRAGHGGRVLLPAEAALAPGRGIQQVAEVVHAPLHGEEISAFDRSEEDVCSVHTRSHLIIS